MKIVQFTKPGESITIGAQRLDQNSLTVEQAEELLKVYPELADKIKVIEQKVTSVSAEEEKPAKGKKSDPA